MELTPDTLAKIYRSAPDPPLLRGLRDVDWAAVSDAYGPATRIPSYLRALMADDPDQREFARQLLFQTIWHQGTVYSASAAAIPFLFNLLEVDGFHDKRSVAHLIANIANRDPPFVHCATEPNEAAIWRGILSKSGRSLEAEIAEGQAVAEEIRRQVARRVELLSPYSAAGPADHEHKSAQSPSDEVVWPF